MNDTVIVKTFKLLSVYSLLLMNVSELTPMKKTLLDVSFETLDPNLFLKTLLSDAKFVMTLKYTIKEGGVLTRLT